MPIRKLFVRFNKEAIIFERIKGGVGGHRKPLYTNFKQNFKQSSPELLAVIWNFENPIAKPESSSSKTPVF